MKISKILLALATLALCGTAAAQTGRDLQDDELHGAVKRIDSRMYEASYDLNDSLQRGEQLEHLISEYKQNGQRRSQTYLSVAEDIIFRTRYKHDDFGLTTLEHIVDNQEHVVGRTYYVYNADLILTEIYVEDAERQVESRMLLKYDTEGRISQRSYNDHRNDVYKREVYTYNPDGTINKAVVYDRSKQKVQEKRWEYDDKGYPTSYTLYDYTEEEPEMFVTLYQREYDAHGNWVRCTEYDMLGDSMIPTYTTVRNIEYF